MLAVQWVLACALTGQVPPGVVNGRFVLVQGAMPGAPAVAPAIKPPIDAVVTIHDERVEGLIDGFENGQLALATQPPRKLALDEIDRIDFARQPEGLSVVWMGQDNHDVVPANAGSGGNGIQDIHLQCRGMPAGHSGRQFFVFAPRVGGELHVWANLETQAFWRVHSDQAPGQNRAEIYVEPPPGDCFGQEWEVWVTLDDNQVLKATVRATTHTDNKLKVGAAAAVPPAADAPVVATILLDGDGMIRGDVVGLDEDSLSLKTAGGDKIKIPLVQMRAGWLGGSRPEQLAEKLGKRGETDWVLFKTRENAPTAIDGNLKGLADGKLALNVAGEVRNVAADRLLGFVLAARPPQPRPASFHQVFELRDGQKISGRLTAVKPDTVELQTFWDVAMRLPRAQLQSITCQNGKVTYLSDLEPAAVEEAPYFGQPRPYQRDRNLQGGSLAVKGTVYRKGLAVHSRSVLSYALDGRYALFQTTLGFDDAAPPGGSVACRVLADGRELYANPTLRQAADPVPLKLSVEGVQQLVLEIDFGEGEDIGDRVIWAGARLIQAKPAAADKAAPQTKPQ